jgi:hypothetical protein
MSEADVLEDLDLRLSELEEQANIVEAKRKRAGEWACLHMDVWICVFICVCMCVYVCVYVCTGV